MKIIKNKQDLKKIEIHVMYPNLIIYLIRILNWVKGLNW